MRGAARPIKNFLCDVQISYVYNYDEYVFGIQISISLAECLSNPEQYFGIMTSMGERGCEEKP